MNSLCNLFSSRRQTFLLLGVFFIFGLDFCIYVLSISGYYFTEGAAVIYKVVYSAHFLYLYIALIIISKTKFSKVFWSAIGPFLLSPILVIGGFLFFYDKEQSYYTIIAPNSLDIVTISHYNWSLGETNHYYDFYQNTLFPGLQKRVNKEPLHIMTRNTNASDLEVLGVHKVTWINREEVHFASTYQETTIHLK